MINSNRDERSVDLSKAAQQAEMLYQAGEGKLGTDEDAFVEVLANANQRQAYLIFEEYKKVSGRTIEQALKAEMSGDLLNGLLALGTLQLPIFNTEVSPNDFISSSSEIAFK